MKTKKKTVYRSVKPKKVALKTRSVSKQKNAIRKTLRRRRPLHKKVLLHPVNFFFLLCVGVFLTGLTFHVFADTLTVNGSVFAPLPTTTPDITWPADQTHFSTVPISVTGVCEPNSYVKLMRNSVESGVASCGPSDSAYSIETDLMPGTNDLYARIFNITDNEGPASAHITVYYDVLDNPPAIPPIVTPTTLQLSSTEDDKYTKGRMPIVSPYPTMSGFAPPRSHITIEYHSEPLLCTTYADNQGYWTCSLNDKLTDGLHEVYISAVTPEGKKLTVPMFFIRVLSTIAPLHRPMANVSLFSISALHHDVVYSSGDEQRWDVSIHGGASPYAFNVLWGDGEKETLVRNSSGGFSVKHSYELGGTNVRSYTIKIDAVDIKGLKTTLQLASLVRGVALSSGATIDNDTHPTGIGKIKQWMWILWPSYLIVTLMTVSFWLGEKQERLHLHKLSRSHRV